MEARRAVALEVADCEPLQRLVSLYRRRRRTTLGDQSMRQLFGAPRAAARFPLALRPVFVTPGYRHVHAMRRVCVLDPPLRVKSLETKSLAVVKEAIFSQKHNRKITEHWWLLYELLVRRYPDLAGTFKPYSPARV